MSIESKSLLAKLMATENLIIEHRKVRTAMFDTANRVLIVPVLDKNIPSHTYDLFMGHEVGHALWTPRDSYEQEVKLGVNGHISNIVEDVRIERKIKQKYPGLRNSFLRGYNDLLERDFFKIKDRDLNSLNLLDRINLYFKLGVLVDIFFSKDEKKLVDKIENAETYDDVLNLSLEIEKFVKDHQTEYRNKIILPEMEEDDEDYDDLDDLSSDKEGDSLEIEMEKGESNEKSDEKHEESDESEYTDSMWGADSDENQDGDEIQEKPDEKGALKSHGAGSSYDDYDDVSDLLQSETVDAYKENEHKLFSDEMKSFVYCNVPKIDKDMFVLDYKKVYSTYASQAPSWFEDPTDYKEKFFKMKKEIAPGVSYLVKEFEMRKSADQLKRASTSKTGELNMSKIYSHRYNEDIFKKITVTPGAKSHGLVIFLDWSGSMDDHLENTVKQLFNIVMFCKKVNIPYEVYTFTDAYDCNNQHVEYKQNDLILANFKMLNILSSRMNASEFTHAAETLMKVASSDYHRPGIFSMGGTPLNETVIAAFEIVPEFQKKYKLQIVNTIFLTDGEGCPSSMMYTNGNRAYMRDAERSNEGYVYTSHIIRDPVTKHEKRFPRGSSAKQTAALLKLLKIRAKCNVIGFYIISPGEFKRYIDRYIKPEEVQVTRSTFSKDHCAVIKNAGFDEYYLLRSAKGDASEEVELEVSGDMTSKKMTSEFKKFIKKKSHNRNVLNRFISLIA